MHFYASLYEINKVSSYACSHLEASWINDPFYFFIPEASEYPDDNVNVAMYVGLIVAIAVFITVMIIIIFLLRRHKGQQGGGVYGIGIDSFSGNDSFYCLWILIVINQN